VRILAFLLLLACAGADSAAIGKKRTPQRKPANAAQRNRMLASKNLEEKIQNLTTKSQRELEREKSAAAERFAIEQRLIQQDQERGLAGRDQWGETNLANENRTRAERLMNIVRDQEFRRALEKVTPAAKKIWDENEEIHSPLTVIASGAAFWAGRTFRIVRKEYLNLTTRIEGRNKSAQFNWSSPIVNGELRFNGNEGNADMMVGRTISSIETSSQIHYNFTTQSIQGSIVQPITREFQFSIQAGQNNISGQTDAGARLQFRKEF
jgi:hypothetical protein